MGSVVHRLTDLAYVCIDNKAANDLDPNLSYPVHDFLKIQQYHRNLTTP